MPTSRRAMRTSRAASTGRFPKIHLSARSLPRRLSDVEIGLKSQFSTDNVEVRANIAAYRGDYEDIQRTTPENVGGIVLNVTRSAAEARIQGVEFTGTLGTVFGLTLNGSYSYIDSEYTKVADDSAEAILAGAPFPYTPKNKYSVGASYETQLGSLGTLVAERQLRAPVRGVDRPDQPELLQVPACVRLDDRRHRSQGCRRASDRRRFLHEQRRRCHEAGRCPRSVRDGAQWHGWPDVHGTAHVRRPDRVQVRRVTVDSRGRDDWTVSRHGSSGVEETLFALADGVLGVRASLEEQRSFTSGTYIAGVFEQTPIHYHERLPGFAESSDTRVPVVDGMRLRVEARGQALGHPDTRLESCDWRLDLRSGVVTRTSTWLTSHGRLEIRSERVMPGRPGASIALRYTVRSIDFAGDIQIASLLDVTSRNTPEGGDPRIGVNLAGGGLSLATAGVQDGVTYCVQKTSRSGIWVAAAQAHRLASGLQHACRCFARRRHDERNIAGGAFCR